MIVGALTIEHCSTIIEPINVTPRRSNRMPYKVEVEWSPAYELLTSLRAYLQFRGYGSTLELRSDWSSAIRKRGGKELAEAIQAAGKVDVIDLLLWQSPSKETVESALDWLGSLSRGEIIDKLISFYSDCGRDVADGVPTKSVNDMTSMATKWDKVVDLLSVWNKVYFSAIDPAIMDGLRKDAAEKRNLAASMSPEDLIEDATFGVRLDPTEEEVRVLLIPQFHFRPWNIWKGGRGFALFSYPADVIPPQGGMPPQSVVRMTRALSDPNRLKILKAIASGAQSFTDVFGPSGLAKSTVHHHLMALRAAGLVRTRVPYPFGTAPDRYSLRAGTLDTLADSLSAYLKEE